MNLTIVPGTLVDVIWVANHLRHADRVELGNKTTEQVELILYHALHESTWCKVAHVDGIPAVAYGVAPTERLIEGSPWMLATDRIHHIRRGFVRGCRVEVAKMQACFPYLHNYVHRGNQTALRWLRWLGFTIDPAPTGRNGEFYHFWKGA